MKRRKFDLGLSSLTPEEINELTKALHKTQEQRKESFIQTYHENEIQTNHDKKIIISTIKK